MIGIFDSGIGGITIFNNILKELPNYKYIYYSDSINNPYGDKSKEEIIKISKNIINLLIKKGCQIIVIACNTASTIAVNTLRKEFDIPIIAVEPAYKMVYDNNYNDKALILATKGTLESDKFKKLYQQYNNYKTSLYECTGLADLIEKDQKEKIKEYLKKNISQFIGINCVVLGCTHYPLIKNEIKEILGNVNFYDSAVGTTKILKDIIKKMHLLESQQEIIFIDSSNSNVKKKRFYNLLNNI